MNHFIPTLSRALVFAFLLSWAGLHQVSAQQFFYSQDNNSKKIRIPFEYENNFIVVRVYFNNFLPLKFIFDTGAEHTLLTKREITDLMDIKYRRKFPIRGADMSTVMYAFLATGITLRLNDFVAVNRPILVLEKDIFGFEEFSGINVQGIIGADLFRRYIVKIDYRRQFITLYDPERFAPPKKYHEVSIEIFNGKPYLFADVRLLNDVQLKSKLLLDTGAGLALLLYTNSDKRLDMPEKVIRSKIGVGLGGNLEGFLGRVDQVTIKEFEFSNVVTNYQETMPTTDSIYLNQRNGILGNLILDRFTVIIDYVHNKLYLKPHRRRIKQKFQYDRSGIIAVNTGEFKDQITVFYVIPNSPADRAGVESGDEIVRINGVSSANYTLDRFNRKMSRKPGKKIRLRLSRDSETLEVRFQLEDLI